MVKNMKKLTNTILALVMVLALSVTAFAAGSNKTITITGAAGHTYDVYQIFTGDPYADADGAEYLKDALYGTNYVPEGSAVGGAVSEGILSTLKNQTGEEAAAWLYSRLSGEAFTTMSGNAETGIATVDVPAGYYLIVDVTADLPDYDENGELIETLSAYILEVVGDMTVPSKHTSVPEFSKKIDDENDSLIDDPETENVVEGEDAIEWHDSADHDISDLIDFKLEAIIPSEYTLFVHNEVDYPFTFHDVEDTGLSFQPNSVKVYIDGTEITSGYEVVTETTDGCTFEVKFADLTDIPAVKAGSVLQVLYKSELNENAVIGEVGNINKARGEFRNYNSPETPAFTPWDTVIAFTYKVVVNKVDQDNEPLAGAEFTLEKFEASASGTKTYKDIPGEWVALETVKSDAGTVFTFEGLDDGEYCLTETLAPNGYNQIEPIYFTVTAEHNIVWSDQARTDVLVSLTGNRVTGEILFSSVDENGADNEDNALTGSVINNKGTLLPETGGIGTTIFYAVGGVLVLAAIVLLITKKRMKNEG